MKHASHRRIAPLTLAALLACQPSIAERPANEEVDREVASASREHAAHANRQAVREAVSAVLEANRLDLDIRMIGRNSPTVAQAIGSD